MKISCSQSDLKSNLSVVSRAVPSRPTHPVLANVLVVADAHKGKISLTAFDLSLGIRTSFPAQINEGGSVTLPAKLLNDIVARLPEGEVTLVYDEDEMEDNPLVTIQSLSGKFQLRGMKGDEFPELPIVENKEALMLPIKSLTQGLQGSLFAASSDETKQVLTGIHLTRNDNTLEFAATDGHRLAVVQTQDEKYIEEPTNNDEIEDSDELDDSEDSDDFDTSDDFDDSDDSNDSDTSDDFDDSDDSYTSEESEDFEDSEKPENSENPDQNFEITIPARALGELEKILNTTKETESVALYVDEGQVVFELGERHLTSRKLEGGYPNYNQLIPREFSRTMVLERKRLITSLERVAVLSDQKNNLVKFTLDTDDEQLILTVEAKELGNAKESNPAQITGERLEIGFNIKYLMDGLKALPSTDIQFQLNEPTQPVIITPLSGLKMTYLIMPVQIRD